MTSHIFGQFLTHHHHCTVMLFREKAYILSLQKSVIFIPTHYGRDARAHLWTIIKPVFPHLFLLQFDGTVCKILLLIRCQFQYLAAPLELFLARNHCTKQLTLMTSQNQGPHHKATLFTVSNLQIVTPN